MSFIENFLSLKDKDPKDINEKLKDIKKFIDDIRIFLTFFNCKYRTQKFNENENILQDILNNKDIISEKQKKDKILYCYFNIDNIKDKIKNDIDIKLGKNDLKKLEKVKKSIDTQFNKDYINKYFEYFKNYYRNNNNKLEKKILTTFKNDNINDIKIFLTINNFLIYFEYIVDFLISFNSNKIFLELDTNIKEGKRFEYNEYIDQIFIIKSDFNNKSIDEVFKILINKFLYDRIRIINNLFDNKDEYIKLSVIIDKNIILL